MKKFLFIIPITFLICCFYFVPVKASAGYHHYGYVISYDSQYNTYTLNLLYYDFDHWEYETTNNTSRDNQFFYGQYVITGQTFNSWNEAEDAITDFLYYHPMENYSINSSYSVSLTQNYGDRFTNYIFNIPYRRLAPDANYEDITNPPNPPEPEPGSNWLNDVWKWFLWQLGINDDYSGDIDAYITGGDRERMEMVTPTSSPTPTPVPSPTPYTLNIIDNNGNPVYTITGIPGSTYNITNTTNNNDGSDFDIFEVDLKIGDGGSTNPRDGLNDVMDSSLTYLSDPENVDMQPVGDSFSIIPSDWFLLLGVIACFPFIAGFIAKLLK